MPDIPSVGISAFDTTDPGAVNVEAQAYPRPLDLAQTLALSLNFLASRFQPNGPPPDVANGPLSSAVAVESQPFRPFPLSMGVADDINVEVNVAAQNVIRQPVAEFLITEVGSFNFNPSVPDIVRRTIKAAVTSFVDPVNNITYFVINFGPTVNLMDFGVSLVGTQAAFPNSAPANNPQAVPAALITAYTNQTIVVVGTNLALAVPVVGNFVDFDVSRHGPEGVFQLVPNDINVTVDAVQSASAASTSVAPSNPTISVLANDGVLVPFVGTGTRIPLLLWTDLRETAFFPADRPIATQGLPLNVNIG